MSMIIHLNNGDKLRLDRPARSENMATLAKQISECGLVHSVDCDVTGPDDEVERYRDGKCIGFLSDLLERADRQF